MFFHPIHQTICYNTIDKIHYDFALYLIENDLVDEEKVQIFITDEQNRIIETNRIREQQETEYKKKYEQEIKAKAEFVVWLNNEAASYNNTEKLNLLKEIFLNETGGFGGGSIRLLVLIDNFDDMMCKAELKSWLSYFNTASLKTFFHITGINLGKTDKEIQKKLDEITSKDFTGMIPYKKKKERTEVEQVTFYKFINNEFQECQGEEIKKHELDLYITKNAKGYYSLTEGQSGCCIGQGNTKQEMYESFENLISRNGIDKIKGMIQDMINKHGISPKYRQEVAV